MNRAQLIAMLGLVFATGTLAQDKLLAVAAKGAPKFTTIDAPGASKAAYQGTQATSVNEAGTIAGWYADVNLVYHGFVRDPNGTMTVFDAPGAGTGLEHGTVGVSINSEGAIAGYVSDARMFSTALCARPVEA
jgi:hypothetical protein